MQELTYLANGTMCMLVRSHLCLWFHINPRSSFKQTPATTNAAYPQNVCWVSIACLRLGSDETRNRFDLSSFSNRLRVACCRRNHIATLCCLSNKSRHNVDNTFFRFRKPRNIPEVSRGYTVLVELSVTRANPSNRARRWKRPTIIERDLVGSEIYESLHYNLLLRNFFSLKDHPFRPLKKERM